MNPEAYRNVAIPSALTARIEEAARIQHRPPSDVVRTALEQYLKNSSLPVSNSSGMRSPIEAAARMRQSRPGNTLPEGITLRELMTHGRA